MEEPFSHIRPDDHHLYGTFDMEAPEDEVVELIVAFVRAMKPKIVVETGTANGWTATKIGKAIVENGNDGWLHTFEIDPDKVGKSINACLGLPVTVHEGHAQEVSTDAYGPIDLLFIDAVLEARHLEYLHWKSALRPGGIAILHDTMKFDPPKSAVEELGGNQIWIPTPRGVTILQER